MIRAVCFESREQWLKAAMPGSFYIDPAEFDPMDLGEEEAGDISFWYFCPCGCGYKGRLIVGENQPDGVGPIWRWNGSKTEPTLLPSVQQVCFWSGHLSDGYWVPA